MNVRRFMIAALGSLFLCRGVGAATSVTMDGPMTDANAALGVAATTYYTLNMDDHNIDVLAVQTIYSSATFPASVSFNDGRASTATITVTSFAGLSTATAAGQLTVLTTSSLAGVVASTSILISSNVTGTVLTITGPPPNVPNRIVVGGNVAAGATTGALATNISGFWSTTTSHGLFSSSVSGSSVTFQFVSSGTFGNAYAITSSSQAAISSATFVGGVQPASVTVAGAILRANSEWQVGADTTSTASNIAAAINLYIGTNTAVAQPVISSNAFNVVGATAANTGSVNNGMTLASGISSITVSGPFFTGGQDNAVLTVNGTSLTANNAFYPITSNAITAAAIVTAWNSTAGSQTVRMSNAAAVIGATTTAVGTSTTYAIRSSSQGALTLSPFTSSSPVTGIATGSMYGGQNSSFTINTQSLTIASHGLPLGLQVFLSTTSGTANLLYSTATTGGTQIVLGQNTTYFVTPIDSNHISLALTSTGAVAGQVLTWVSSAAPTTTDTYTLNIATSGAQLSGSFGYWVSNDGNQYQQLGSTNTANFVYPSTSTYTDVGSFDWKFFQARVVPPAQGAMPIKVYVHGEKR